MSKRIGEDIPIHVKHYDVMDSSERQAFQQLVETGGEVRIDSLSDRIKAANLLGYVVQENRLVAVGSLKHPAESYVRKVSRCSGFDLGGYAAELGWIFVIPVARGMHLASRISKALCGSYEGSIFATTRSDNTPMQAILRNVGFVRVGAEYDPVEHPGKKLQLWVLERGKTKTPWKSRIPVRTSVTEEILPLQNTVSERVYNGQNSSNGYLM